MQRPQAIKPKHTKLFLFGTFVSFGLTIALVSFFLSSYLQTKTLRQELVQSAHTELSSKQTLFQKYLQRVEKSLTGARYCDLMVSYLEDRSAEPRRQKAQSCLLAIANSLPEMTQLRYLDEFGMERIRIDKERTNGLAYASQLGALQNKAHRYYSQQIAELPSGTLWTSPLDLNIEHGKVVEPYQPTLRIGTPVYHNDRYQGFIILNLLMEPVLKHLTQSRLFDVMLADQEGTILVRSQNNSQDMLHLWGGVTGQSENLSEHWPGGAAHTPPPGEPWEEEEHFSIILKQPHISGQTLTLWLRAKPGALNALRTEERKYLVLVTITIIICSLLLGLSFSGLLSRLYRKLFETREALKKQLDLVDRYISITHTDKQGMITSSNAAFHDLLGFHTDELLGKSHNICQHPDTPDTLYQELWSSIEAGKEWHGEIKDQHKDGHALWLSLRVTPEIDEQGQVIGYTAIFRDISARKILEQQALTDPLTGLYNRRHFDATCTRELRRCAREQLPLALALIDTDCFKQYNDTFGHEAGDRILIQIAHCMTQGLHRATDFAFRVGGDEFAILFSSLDADHSRRLLDNIRKSLEQLNISHPGNAAIGIATISVGIALIQPTPTSQQVELYQAADEALYQAKDAGRNRVCLNEKKESTENNS